jgi:FtsP/CotA-like multicopper oxidase with cupredoxin domain
MAEWTDLRLPDGAPDPSRLFLTVNGRPWPHVERMEYDLGDSIRWRVINLSPGPHAFHLHGFYYQVNAKGDVTRDSLYWPAQRRSAVTERLDPGQSMQIGWQPNRPGGWIFHCHMNIHVVPNPVMGAEGLSPQDFQSFLYRNERTEHDGASHAQEGMGGLMTHVYVRPPDGWEPETVARREINLFVDSRPARGGLSGSQFAYVLQDGSAPPAPDSVVLPGSTLFLREGEPTRIRVMNRTPEPTQVHWHGLEIESYFDGVAGLGGYPTMPTPVIQPGEFWDVFVTPDRVGSYMYHSHINDLRQQGSGLYGPLIVLGENETWDPEHDRIFIFGESPFRDDAVSIVNGGDFTAEPMRVGTTYRIRLMQITVNRPATWVTLIQNGFPVTWTPVAKDAFDLPEPQRVPKIAQQSLAVGETYDHLYTPNRPGTLHLELRVANGVLLVDQEIPVVP